MFRMYYMLDFLYKQFQMTTFLVLLLNALNCFCRDKFLNTPWGLHYTILFLFQIKYWIIHRFASQETKLSKQMWFRILSFSLSVCVCVYVNHIVRVCVCVYVYKSVCAFANPIKRETERITIKTQCWNIETCEEKSETSKQKQSVIKKNEQEREITCNHEIINVYYSICQF